MSRKPIILIATVAGLFFVFARLDIGTSDSAESALQIQEVFASPSDTKYRPQAIEAITTGHDNEDLTDASNVIKTRLENIRQIIPAQAEATLTNQVSQAEPKVQKPETIDESALRYFARKGDVKRLKAEIARLQSLYPNWVPPEDPLALESEPSGDMDDLWAMYADGKLSELRTEIARRKQEEAGWTPPEELLGLLELAEERQRIVNSSDLQQYSQVIKLAAEKSQLLTCNNVDILWRVAEAFIKTDRQDRGIDAYSYILTNCEDTQEQFATIQKASQLLPYAPMQPLLAQLKKTSVDEKDYAELMDGLSRRYVADANEDPKLVISDQYVDHLKALAQKDAQASDLTLLGWYAWFHDAHADAEKDFRQAQGIKDSAESAQGLTLVLLSQKKYAEAETVMFVWRDTSEETQKTYLAAATNLLALDPPEIIEEPTLKRMAETTVNTKSVDTARQFGWYANHFDQHKTAQVWFSTALSWNKDDEEAAYGLAVTYAALHDWAQLEALQKNWSEQSSRIAALHKPRGGTSGKGSYVAQCQTRNLPLNASSTVAMSFGWCYMQNHRPMEAVKSFELALTKASGASKGEATYGKALAYLRMGLVDEAAFTATRAPLSSKRANELQTAILTKRATTAFDMGRYRESLVYLDQRSHFQREPSDLMLMRGHSYLNLHRTGEALQIFEALAATGNKDAIRSMHLAQNRMLAGQ